MAEGVQMPQLNAQQLDKRKEILSSMVRAQREARPWLTLKEAAEEVSVNINKDPALLRMINALAASTAIEVA
jgi:hypothetical protein